MTAPKQNWDGSEEIAPSHQPALHEYLYALGDSPLVFAEQKSQQRLLPRMFAEEARRRSGRAESPEFEPVRASKDCEASKPQLELFESAQQRRLVSSDPRARR